MQIAQAIIMGITQGLTEFIPVSSSGHLIVVGQMIGFTRSSLAFEIALDIGTLAALVVFFWRDFSDLARSLVRGGPSSKLAWLLLLATGPAVLAGVVLQGQAETVFRSSRLVAINLILVALVMLAVDRWGSRRRSLEQMTAGRALVIGTAQALALVPGVSRSGITISAGLAQGFDRLAATRFSFLLSAPIIAGATVKVMAKPANWQQLSAEPGLLIAGIAAAGVSGYLAIKFMLSYLSRHGLALFAYYRIIFGGLILLAGAK